MTDLEGIFPWCQHLVTRMRSNAVAYRPIPARGPKRRGRPKKYGKTILLKSLFSDPAALQTMPSPVYGEKDVTLQYRVCDLLWRPAGRIVRFVLVIHPTRGRCLLMCTDTELSAAEIIRLYGLRFKIEHTFKQAVNHIGTLAYHFWMQKMRPLRRRNGNQHLHQETLDYRNLVKRKLNAYHLIHPGGPHRSRPAAISRRRLPHARVAVLRFLVANHPTRYPALRVGCRHRVASATT